MESTSLCRERRLTGVERGICDGERDICGIEYVQNGRIIRGFRVDFCEVASVESML